MPVILLVPGYGHSNGPLVVEDIDTGPRSRIRDVKTCTQKERIIQWYDIKNEVYECDAFAVSALHQGCQSRRRLVIDPSFDDAIHQ